MKRFVVLTAGLLFFAVAHAAPSEYDVEVLVFENRLPELEGGELWTNNPPANANNLAAATLPNDNLPAETGLGAAATALERDGHYRVLTHRRWRQRPEERSATKPVRLRDPAGQLDGTFQFYMSRFLHVDMDLTLQDKTVTDAPAYRLDNHRRVKSQELTYFDHPKFGVLVKITPVNKD